MMLRGPVLVGTNLSGAAEEALRQGQRLAAGLGNELIVCHVLPELLRVAPLFPQFRAIDRGTLHLMQNKAVNAVGAELEAVIGGDFAGVRIVLDSGTPHAGLLTQAEDVGAGVIVVGPGEVAAQVVRHATVPVLVARRSPAGVVVGATDFSDQSMPAIDTAVSEARRRQARLHLVHALDSDMFTLGRAPKPALPYLEGTSGISLEGLDDLRALAEERLKGILTESGLDGEVTISSDHAATAICHMAEIAGAELVVVGTHGRSGLARVTLGSTAEAVIDRAPCSVLVVRVTSS